MNLFDALSREAQEDLVRDIWIALVYAVVEVVPDPDRPDDRSAMKISAEVYDDFLQGIPEIDAEMNRLEEICSGAVDDLGAPLRNDLLAALNMQRDQSARFRRKMLDRNSEAYLADPVVAEFIRPALENPVIPVPVWSLAWTVVMEDDGKLLVDNEEHVYAEGVDATTRSKIQDRMRRMNAVIGKIVRKGMEAG